MTTGLEKILAGGGYSGLIPFQQSLGFTLVSAEHGRMSYTLPPSALTRELLACGSTIGAIATLVDATGGGAVNTTLPENAVSTTRLLEASLVAVPQADETLESEGTVDVVGERTAVARATIRGRGGRLVAVGTVNMFVLRDRTLGEPGAVAAGEAVGAFEVARDVRLVGAGDGIRLEVSPSPGLANSLGTVHGGAAAMLLDLAAFDAERATVAPATPERLNLSVWYLRPTPLDAPFTATAHATSVTRTVVSAAAELHDSQERVTARAISTSLREQPR